MAGPTASILFRESLAPEVRELTLATLENMGTKFKGDEFWINGNPFVIDFGFEYEFEKEECESKYFVDKIGWPAKDQISFVAMCSGPENHRLLGELCHYFANSMNGLIDFQGALHPCHTEEIEKLYWTTFTSHRDWQVLEPHFFEMIKGIKGRIFSIPYEIEENRSWVTHVADPEFMKGWLSHPNFHMVK